MFAKWYIFVFFLARKKILEIAIKYIAYIRSKF